MRLDVAYQLLPKQRSLRTAQVLDHYGVDFECGKHVIADNLDVPIQESDVVLFTGPSGSGKSSLLQAAAAELAKRGTMIDVDAVDLGQNVVIDSLSSTFESALELLSFCGLGEAQILLRAPRELSDGQRCRLRLALALSQRPDWVLADEFTATLDRTLAKVVTFNIRRAANRLGTGLLLATPHTDIVQDLDPDVHIRCDLSDRVSVDRRDRSSQKKSTSHSQRTFGSVRPPDPTGRTSLGGITARIASAPSATAHCCGTAGNRSASACSRPPRCRSVRATASSASPEHGQPPDSRR